MFKCSNVQMFVCWRWIRYNELTLGGVCAEVVLKMTLDD
jgi:hypothetical protein